MALHYVASYIGDQKSLMPELKALQYECDQTMMQSIGLQVVI